MIVGAWPRSGRAIEYSRGSDNKRRLYGELIAATRTSRAALQARAAELAETAGTAAERSRAQVDHFKTYIWSAVVAHHLVLFTRLKLA